jgi:biopolymer transport protein ExbD
MQFYTKAKQPPTINIVSMIDILCILLIFYVATSEFKAEEAQVKIQLPESSQGTKEESQQQPIVIVATKDKRIFIGPTEIPLAELKSELKNRQSGLSNPHFVLKADTGIPLGFFVKVLDASKEAGIANLSLLTEDGNK